MSDHDDRDFTGGSSTALTLPIIRAGETVRRVPHSMPFVAQLIANAHDVPTPPRRRKSDRTGPLRAYAALDATPHGWTRRIV